MDLSWILSGNSRELRAEAEFPPLKDCIGAVRPKPKLVPDSISG